MMKASDMVLVDYDGNIVGGSKVRVSLSQPNLKQLTIRSSPSTKPASRSTLLCTERGLMFTRRVMPTVSTGEHGQSSANLSIC